MGILLRSESTTIYRLSLKWVGLNQLIKSNKVAIIQVNVKITPTCVSPIIYNICIYAKQEISCNSRQETHITMLSRSTMWLVVTNGKVGRVMLTNRKVGRVVLTNRKVGRVA